MANHPSCIFLNDNIPSHATMRGVARYFRHVTDGTIAHFGNQVVIFSHEARDYKPARHIRSVRFRGSEQLGLHDKLATIAMWGIRPGVVFSPWFSNVHTSATKVFTVYDLIYELFPQYHSRMQVPLRNLALERKNCIEQADALIAISHNTAENIVSIYPNVNPAPIVVIHPGVAPFFFERSAPSPVAAHKPYFLYVGARAGHKNFSRLLIAYGQSGLAKHFDLRVITSSPFTSQESEIMQKYRLESSVQLITDANDADLRESYAGSVAFVYPSEYEGFGLSILEAMASGTLVATSDTSSMPEAGGHVAFYFDPGSVESIADCLKRVANLPNGQRRWRIEKGMARARTFSWERCQRQTVDVIERLLN